MPAKTKLAQLIAYHVEGFGPPANKPTRDNNPGDLEHAPHIESWDGAIGVEPTLDDGWADLERQLGLFASRGLTLEQMAYEYWPPSENPTADCLNTICAGLGLPPTATVAAALKIPATI